MAERPKTLFTARGFKSIKEAERALGRKLSEAEIAGAIGTPEELLPPKGLDTVRPSRTRRD